MDFGDLVLIILLFLAGVIGAGTAMLSVLGFSPARGAVITATFLFLGFWNPVGWIVLGLCIWLQVKENRGRLLARQVAPQVTPVVTPRGRGRSVSVPSRVGRPMLRKGK